MADDPFNGNGDGNVYRYTPSPREVARELRELKHDTKEQFDTLRRNTSTTVRWLVGIVVVLVVAIAGAAINARVQIETMNNQVAYQAKQTSDQEQRIRYLEKWIGHFGNGVP